MGDSLDQGRPAKRIKLAPHPQPSHPHSQSQAHPRQRPLRPAPENTPVVPAEEAAVASAFHVLPAAPGARGARRVRRRVRSRGGGRGATSGARASRTPLPAPVDAGSSPASTESSSSLISTSTLPWPAQEQIHMAVAAVDTPIEMALIPLDNVRVEIDLISSSDNGSSSNSISPERESHSPQDLDVSATAVEQVPSSRAEQEHNSPKLESKSHKFVSPFKDCVSSFGQASRRFSRPTDGTVNSYIKFNWPQRRTQGGRSSSVSVVARPGNDADDDQVEEVIRPSTQSSPSLVAPNRHAKQISQATAILLNSQRRFDRSLSFSDSTLPAAGSSHYATSPSAHSWSSHGWATHSSSQGPRMLPSHFGLVSKMDKIDRQLWAFYLRNWCPGRSILGKTNSWLQDFAPMEGNSGVLCAMQSLAGIYVYDYQPLEEISRRINHRFALAEDRLSQLLAKTDPTVDETSELITIASILSMQDIVYTERRRKRPYAPRWLEGFKQCEHFLESIDEGSRFWSPSNVQSSSLRISQSIIVGRAVVLSQIMTPLKSPYTFNPQKESSRFGWLLYGNMEDMYEIHGGCGFSKKLLHSLSQISYLAARLYQDPESPVAPLTARFLLGELLQMRQWSSAVDAAPWEEAKKLPQTIQMVRAAPEGYVIESACHMTEVTAEAWRIAAMIYLQCRALRMHRNHREVMANLNDLAKCINIMPTSGYNFTAQAPLFPVFLLGMLATDPEHVLVAQTWFEKVTSTPVRSSVPPLYETLKRIWTWIDADPNLKLPVNRKLDEDVGKRLPWWEHLVKRVQDQETEILCLT
ncbi:transcriptional regulator family: Fungal Specific TF [Trichoderma aggressivum f. europaeum]|uniref:Transcriptional regulator family: Fungal Specific TF n=1 Tax=Trichoderma aggressivum f. europaeum TaxID=173218 RepID=A0AAE1LY77_9HYPO|nr:transcriptional regulator family: Fungal Specific TF [Trichoderma aggressivum f. europaeum]